MSATGRRGAGETARVKAFEDPLWEVWGRLAAEFSLGRLLLNLVFSRSGWGIYGVDVVSTLRATKTGKRGLAVLAEVPEALLARLADLAGVNARRNEAIWRMAALFYVTIPVTLFLAGLEGAPAVVSVLLRNSGPIVLGLVGFLTLWVLYYFTNNWRARQIEAVVELARIERAGRP